MSEQSELEPPDFDALIANAIANRGETLRFDFKATRDPRNLEERLKLVKTITAFANAAEVGYLFIGIADDGTVDGLATDIRQQYDQSKIKGFLRSYIAPVPRFQTYRPDYQGQRVVVIRVEPFDDIPHVVVSGDSQGNTRLEKGTILIRTLGAECSPLDSETEVRRLCDLIAQRRATRIVELIQRGMIGVGSITTTSLPASPAVPAPAQYLELRQQADQLWQSGEGQTLPYREVFFEPLYSVQLTPQEMRDLVPATIIQARNGEDFPFYRGSTSVIPRPTSQGWTARLPPVEQGSPTEAARYLWLLNRKATFLSREQYWESRSAYPLRVDAAHVIKQLILLVRFLDRVTTKLDLDPACQFRLGANFKGVAGRTFVFGTDAGLMRMLSGLASPSEQDEAVASVVVSLAQMRSSVQARIEVIATLAENVAWELNRTDLTRDQFLNFIGDARNFGGEFAFPERETV